MSDKRTIKRKGIRIFHVLLIILVVYVGFVMNHQRKLMNNLQDRRATVETQITSLEREIKLLNDEIGKSGTLEFIEKVARDDLGMVKPREIIYVDKSLGGNDTLDIFKNDN
ncbi:FtsB family cell division protein [Gudongella sp. SC589]|jgi:cell division protein FtsL|uniref:FtsB family cell division protein n=1 Tax=Gudongella sp. SC589 TaxID=3385990 RepID=UPI003904B71E